MDLDPLLALALNIHASKGVYALLLGSGISRAAKIPTGWEVVLDLIRRVAKLSDEDCEPDPAAWFKAKFNADPDYSKLLDVLAPTANQRQQILRQYFEPAQEEREDGLKQPTKAHRAIAQLVSGGYIRVILTTNFDRLTERAIEDAGITPVVLSSPDSMSGALPLVHQRCVVAKLHGDYLDTRILNTPDELAAYPAVVDQWLDRVLDEFGLIVAGWSGEWDSALRAALQRCKTRRFGFYWASVGEPRQMAKDLTLARGGAVIRISDGDQFFDDLANKVTALNDVYPDHPVNTAAAVALVKRHLSEPKQPIRLHDLIMRETDRAFAEINKHNEALLRSPDNDHAAAVRLYVASTTTLRIVLAVASYWGGDSIVPLISKSLARVAHDPTLVTRSSGVVLNECFRIVPAMVALYAAGLGFVAAGHFVAAADLLRRTRINSINGHANPIVIYYGHCIGDIHRIIKKVPEYSDKIVPLSQMMFDVLGRELNDLFPEPAEFESKFDEFELLMAMIVGDMENTKVDKPEQVWVTPGQFVWKYDHYGLRSPLFLSKDQGDDLTWAKQQEPFVQLIAAGHFKGDWNRLVALRESVAVQADCYRNRWR